MKLIDILVEELPKRGGWRHDVKTMTQDKWKDIWGYNCCQPRLKSSGWWVSKSGADLVNNSKIEVTELAIDWQTATITREQYESALAAKNDGWIEWGGGRFPPVSTNTFVDVKLENGDVQTGLQAGEYSWEHNWKGSNIIAYRLHHPHEVAQNEAEQEADLNECIGQDAAPVWNGEGLPPAGCECEYTKESLPGDEWNQCTVDYVGSSFFVYRDCYGVELTGIIGDIKFRPIRSEADRKRDESLRVIYEILDAGTSTKQDAADIYDAIAAGKIPGVKLED